MDVSYKEAYAMNPEQARMKLVETYLTCGSIAETARRWHTSRNLVRKRVRRFEEEGLPGFQDDLGAHVPPLLKLQGKSKPRSGKRENAQVMEGKGFPGTCGRRKAWFSPLTRSDTSLRGNGYTNRRKRRKAFYPAH